MLERAVRPATSRVEKVTISLLHLLTSCSEATAYAQPLLSLRNQYLDSEGSLLLARVSYI
jgi:hypothetical protein